MSDELTYSNADADGGSNTNGGSGGHDSPEFIARERDQIHAEREQISNSQEELRGGSTRSIASSPRERGTKRSSQKR